MKFLRILPALVLAGLVAACGGSKSSTSPTPTPTGPATLTKPAPDSPADGEQLDNVRPTLTVVNGTSNQSGAKTYEFEIPTTDVHRRRNWLSRARCRFRHRRDAARRSYVGQDLQPTTKLARTVRSARSRLVQEHVRRLGYNKPLLTIRRQRQTSSIGGSGNIVNYPDGDRRTPRAYILRCRRYRSARFRPKSPGRSEWCAEQIFDPTPRRDGSQPITDQRAIAASAAHPTPHRVEGHS